MPRPARMPPFAPLGSDRPARRPPAGGASLPADRASASTAIARNRSSGSVLIGANMNRGQRIARDDPRGRLYPNCRVRVIDQRQKRRRIAA